MNYKAIIFDMDGTIIDTEHVWKHANKTLIERRGVVYTPELADALSQRLGSLALHQSCAIIKEVAGLEDPLEHLIQEKSALARELFGQGIRFIDGFSVFHARVVAHNMASAVATNADEHLVRITNETLGLHVFFGEHLYSISSIGNIGKPKPDIYLHAAKKLGIQPHECIVIEDSAHGITAAKAAGMHCIGINTAKNRHNLREADVVVEGYNDIELEKMLGLKKVE